MEIMSIKNLKFAYDKNHSVFSDFSMTCEEGEMVLIHGSSGKGKSTLASLMAGHLKPGSGEIVLNGQNVLGPSRKVVVVHQENDLFPWLTVKGHLEFLQATELETQPVDYESYLKRFKILEAAHLYPHQISGGMKRRLAILRGMFLRPRVLILDESISSLDDALKVEVMNEVKTFIKNEKMTLIVIDHNSKSIDHFFDRRIEL